MKAFSPIRRVRQYLRPRGASGGITLADVVTSGTDSPEGNVIGSAVNQQYYQLAGDGLTVVTVWIFNGTPGTDTGWITWV